MNIFVRYVCTLSALLLSSCALISDGQDIEAADCSPSGGLSFLCGPVGSEDIVNVPNSNLLLLSGLALGRPGTLYLVNSESNTYQSLDIMQAALTEGNDCDAPPEGLQASFSGLELVTSDTGKFKVFAVNGKRNAVEMFLLNTDAPALEWEGCLSMPAGTRANGVAVSPGGVVWVTSFYNPNDPNAWGSMAEGKPTGAVYIRAAKADSGFQKIPGLDAIAGPNGVEFSADGKFAYVSAWASRELLIYSTDSGAINTIALNYLPDNIRRTSDSNILVAGQQTTVRSIESCGKNCPQPWLVELINPGSGVRKILARGPGTDTVNYATGATLLNHTLYITVRGENRMAMKTL